MERRFANPLLTQGLSAETEPAEAKRALRRMTLRSRLGDCPKMQKLVEAMQDEIDDPIRFLEWSILTPAMSEEVEGGFRQAMSGYEVDLRSCVLRLKDLRSLVDSSNTLDGRHACGVLYLHEAWFRTTVLVEDQSLERVPLEACLRCWAKSMRLLGPPFNSEAYWSTINRRARRFEDARLSANAVNQIRRGLFRKMIAPAGGLIRLALELRRYQLVDVMGKIFRDRGAFDEQGLECLRIEISGFTSLLDRRFGELEARTDVSLASGGSIPVCVDLARQFESQFSREVKLITRNEDIFGSEGRLVRDRMAMWLQRVAVHAYNEHEDVRLAMKMIQAALRIVDSGMDEQRLKTNLRDLRQFTDMDWS